MNRAQRNSLVPQKRHFPQNQLLAKNSLAPQPRKTKQRTIEKQKVSREIKIWAHPALFCQGKKAHDRAIRSNSSSLPLVAPAGFPLLSRLHGRAAIRKDCDKSLAQVRILLRKIRTQDPRPPAPRETRGPKTTPPAAQNSSVISHECFCFIASSLLY
jgi:hypothetical protein